MSDAIRAAIQAERDAFRALLAKIRYLVKGRAIPPSTVVDMIESGLDDREYADKDRKTFD